MNDYSTPQHAMEVDELVALLIDGHLTDDARERLNALIAKSPDALRRYHELLDTHTALTTMYPGSVYETLNATDNISESCVIPATSLSREPARTRSGTRVLAAFVVAVIVVCALAIWFLPVRSDEQFVATVTAVSGAHIWTGDRGEIVRDIEAGVRLSGGTIEGMAPDSWFELKFNDGSKIVIAGISLLTFSDDGQKILRLREGQLTADVNPQPKNRPMLVHTRTAAIEVVGTRFDVQSAMASTVLNVSEGEVRLRRLSDGREVDVQAEHVVVADDESPLVPERVPTSVHRWASDFDSQTTCYGRWKPASGDRPASIKAIPLVPPGAPHVTLHLAGISVRKADGSRVVVQKGSRFVVEGLLDSQTPVYFGIRVNYPNGDFAGMFRGDLQEEQVNALTDAAGRFQEIYELSQFTVDPAVWDKRHELAPRPDELVLDGVWVFTHSDPPAGLEITEVELVPPAK